MDDMNAFDRQLASVVLRRVGPPEPVDDAAIFGAITATQSPKWRFQTMFSATKIVVAGAIVALFGGFLLAGLLLHPTEEQRPVVGAPASAEASPTEVATTAAEPTTWTPPPGLVTEELAPGVLFASHAGVGSSRTGDFAFDADGSIWLLHKGRLKRVGDAGSLPGPSVGLDFADLTGSPDGALWSLAKGTVASFRDGAWTTAPAFPGEAPAKALEVLPDGTVWARSTTTLARLDGDAWTAFPIADERGPLPDYRYIFPWDLAWTPDGSLWVTTCQARKVGEGGLLRFDGVTFHPAVPPVRVDRCILPLASGTDGELWAFLETDPPTLARFDGSSWKLSGDDAGVPRIQGTGGYVGNMVVAPDGRLWAVGNSDRGVALGVYDGTRWTDVFVPPESSSEFNLTERPLQVAPDSTIWVWIQGGFLVTTAEAVATAE